MFPSNIDGSKTVTIKNVRARDVRVAPGVDGHGHRQQRGPLSRNDQAPHVRVARGVRRQDPGELCIVRFHLVASYLKECLQ